MERIVTGAEAVLQDARGDARRSGVRTARELPRARWTPALPQLSGFAVAGPDGRPDLRDRRDRRRVELKAQPWFAEAFDRRGFAVGTYTTGPGSPYLPVAISTEEAPPRVLVTAIDLAWLGARLRERNLAAGSVLTVADRDGTLLAREPEPERFVGRPIAPDFAPLLDADRPGTAELREPRRHAAHRRLSAAGGDRQRPLRRRRHLEGRGFRADLRLDAVARWLLVAAGAVAACLVAWLVGDRLFRRPIRRILATVASWRAGDETARTGIAADASELSELAAAIDGYMDEPRGGARRARRRRGAAGAAAAAR